MKKRIIASIMVVLGVLAWAPRKELTCNNWIDNDHDGRIDCRDKDCACLLGWGKTGDECDSHNDCFSFQKDQFCFDPIYYGFSHGYCSQQCNLNNDDCPGDSVCLGFGYSVGACFDGCLTDNDCKEWQVCLDHTLIDQSLPNNLLICYPFELDCDDEVDNDQDGLTDCQDEDCGC